MNTVKSPFALFWRRGLWALLSLTLLMLMLGSIIYIYIESSLPDVETLKTVQLQVPLRIYSSDNKLIAEYGEKRRIPVRYDQIPKPLINAVLATEDQRFYDHSGVDVLGLMRAGVNLIRTGTKAQGGSTITMQVARNFFLSPKKSYMRKLREIMLAIKIDHELGKEKILELYLNKIFLGNRAYGVAAAAEVYYGKTLQQLTLPEMAMIAGIPKAPSKLNPLGDRAAAVSRRNHVLQRMLEQQYIGQAAYDAAIRSPLTGSYHGRQIDLPAPYIAEAVRQTLFDQFGQDAYTDGYQVYTTVDSHFQHAANRAVRLAILDYDKRHGYRGAEKNIGAPTPTYVTDWTNKLSDIPVVNHLIPAVVVKVDPRQVTALSKSGKLIEINWDGLSWARKQFPGGGLGAVPQSANEIVKPGDLIRIIKNENKTWQLAQVPQVEGALVSLDPKDGAIRSLVGGFNFEKSSYNRAIQAQRQPGSSFKPFIYAAALAKGYTLASVINDAPIAVDDPSQEDLWRPQNDDHKFHGPTRLRVALSESINLVSIRLLDAIGIPYVVDYASHFGFDPKNLPKTLSLALGSLTTTPLQMAKGYAVFANGGYKVDPYIIDHIENANGEIIFRSQPKIACMQCTDPQTPNTIPAVQQAPRVIPSQIAYLMTLAMRDVIQHGTGSDARVLNRPDLAGKTGTTNDKVDAWFVGFNSQNITAVWVGFDQPQPLHEYGREAALPMWINYMGTILKGTPVLPLVEPPGLVTVQIDPKTGLLATKDEPNSMPETFIKETAPHGFAPSIVEDPSPAGGQQDQGDHIF